MKIETWFDKFKRWLWLQFMDTISGSTIGDLPDKFMYFFGALNHISILTIFIALTVTGYYAAVNSYYLVPNDQPEIGGTCSNVPREMPSGLYVADTKGKYLGQAGFAYPEAIYTIQTNNLKISLEDYQNTVSGLFKSAVDRVAKEAKGYDLSRNLITYLAWKVVFPDPQNNLQIFSFTGHIEDVFNSKFPGDLYLFIYLFIYSLSSKMFISYRRIFICDTKS
jgi:hypothetical protein